MHPDLVRRVVAREELRERHRPGHARPRDDRRGDHRRGARQLDGHRRPLAGGRAHRREGRLAERDDRGRGRGEGDPVGGRQRRARDQHLPRRPPRPPEAEPRHLLAARGGGDPLRGEARRGRGRGRRERRPGAALAVALRELPGRAPARPRRERAHPERRRRPGSRTATPSTTTSPLPARTSSRRSRARSRPSRPGCQEQGYTPCASDEFRPPDGTSFAAPQVTAVAANLLGVRPLLRPEQVTAIIERTAVDATASSGCRTCAARPRPVDGMGRPRRDGRDRRARRRRAAARRARAERQRRRGRVPALLRTGREGALRSGVGRLLGRPGRRLRRSTCGAASGSSRRSSPRCRATSCSPSGARGRRQVTGLAPPNRRVRHLDPRRAPRAARLDRRSRRAGTTSRRASRRRATARGVPPLDRPHAA